MFLLALTVVNGCERGGSSLGPESNTTALCAVPDAVARAKANNTAVDPTIVAADNGCLGVLQALQECCYLLERFWIRQNERASGKPGGSAAQMLEECSRCQPGMRA